MDAKLIMQAVAQYEEYEEDEEDDATKEGGSEAAPQQIVIQNFTDYNGAEINDLIQCTAPRSIAKSWLSGGVTKEHIDNSMLFMINESFDRDHDANKFMQNVQYYFGADLQPEVLEDLKEGNVESPAFKTFFVSCLDQSAEFKRRNKKFCKGSERYSADKPARANANRAVKRAFK